MASTTFRSDEAEEAVASSMIEGVVMGALEAEVSPELILVAVHRAIEKDREQRVRAVGGPSSTDELMEQLKASIDRIGGQ